MLTRSNQIQGILESKGLSIYRLAKRVEMSYQSIHKLATATAIPEGTAYGTLRRVSGALGVTIDDLEISSLLIEKE